MNCTEIRPLLSSYIDGETTPEERVRVEHHLSRCEDCHQALAEYRAIGSNIHAMAMPVPPASLRRDVWRAIEARESGRRVFGNPAGNARKTQTVDFPRTQGRSGAAAIFTSLGNGWARALPAALLVGGLLLVMAVILLRGTIATPAAQLLEVSPISDYNKPIHIKFNKQVDPDDAKNYTSVRRMKGTTPVTVTVQSDYMLVGTTGGELTLSPVSSWLPGATYQVYINCQRIRTIIENGVMQNEPLTLTFTAAAHTPTATSTPTSTATPTNTPVPPSNTPEPTAIALESSIPAKTPSVPLPTQTKSVSTAVAASPTTPKASPTVAANPTNTVVPVTPTAVSATAVPPTFTPEPVVTATVRPSQTATVVPTAPTVTATSIRKSTPTVTPTATPRVSVTATPPCSLMPVRGFGQVWRTDSSVRGRVGCPVAPEGEVTPTAYQRFEGGYMFWRGDTRTIYVFRGGPTDTYGVWRQFPDTWQEGDPLPSKTPPAKLYAPVRGFGKVWYENESLQLDLGWAVEPESNTGAVWQQYERGNALWTADRVIRFLYSDGIYARFEDTFVPQPGE